MSTEKKPTRKAAAAKKPATRRRAAKPAAPTPEQIAERAYFIALNGGRDPFHNWLRAEQELRAA
jgi:hypothetical protein